MTEDEISAIHAMNGALIKFTVEQCRYNCADKKETITVFESLAVSMMNRNRHHADMALKELYNE